MPTQCVKLGIKKTLNDDLYDILNNIIKYSYMIANDTIKYYYEKDILKINHEITDYMNVAQKYGDVIGSNVINDIRKMAANKWKQHKKMIINSCESVINFKKDLPISCPAQSYDIKKENNNYILSLALLPGRNNRKSLIINHGGDKSKIYILEMLVENKFKKGSVKLYKQKNKWLVNISYTFDKIVDYELDEERVMGVDMGIVNAIAFAYNFSEKRGYIRGDEILAFKKRVEKRREAIQEQIKYSNRRGRGRKRALLPLEKLSKKYINFKETCNHRYSSYIVEQALKNKCKYIQMEDLSGIKNKEKFLQNWIYYDLQSKIEYKAKQYGIEVIKVNPYFTSQRCSKCGFIHEDNRKTQSEFKCLKCGFEANADYNAAKNLSIKNIDKIIKNYQADSAALR